MTEILDLYKCEICGNIVEVVVNGEGELSCCGQPMDLMQANSIEQELLGEKHVPIIEETDVGVNIRVGSVPHPMEDNHYIVFIEAMSEDKKYLKRKYLFPHEEPVLKLKCNCHDVIAREFCNIHGLWISENKERQE
jgi:superoxide reductase